MKPRAAKKWCGALRVAAVLLAAHLGAGCESSGAPTQHELPVSPFGTVLYEGYPDGVPEIMHIDTAGGTPTRLLPQGTIAMDPTPSPDGSRIAFVVANYQEATGDIFVINRDGSGLQQLTFAPELDDSPAWSPDGQRLVFRSYRGGYEGEIWRMDADGTNAVSLTPNPLPGVADNRQPHWSPDGQAIVYATNLAGDFGIWLMDIYGGNKLQLTNTPELDAEPVWSPDGEWIAFRRHYAGGGDIMILPANGGAPLRIELAGHQAQPAWSPDGEWLAFVHQPTLAEQPEIHVMRRNGEQMRKVTSDPAWGGGQRPVWWHESG